MVKGYKVLNLDMTDTALHSDNLVYEIGKWYRIPQGKLNRFKFCEKPEDLFVYFSSKNNNDVRIFECESDGNYKVQQVIYHNFIEDCEKTVECRICEDIQRCTDIQERVKILDEMKNCQKTIESGNNLYVADSIRLTRELSAIEKAELYDKLVIHKDCCCRYEAAKYGRKQDLEILINDIEPFVKKLAKQKLSECNGKTDE